MGKQGAVAQLLVALEAGRAPWHKPWTPRERLVIQLFTVPPRARFPEGKALPLTPIRQRARRRVAVNTDRRGG